MFDTLVVGAGPAGSVAAIVLARAGVRVLLLERARFPRDKLCGDTLNPGALAVLRRLNLPAADGGLPVEGMLVTGVGGARVAAHYPPETRGRALVRRDLDAALLQLAADAGVTIELGALVDRPLVDGSAVARVTGVSVRRTSSALVQVRAPLVIAADGRASRLARTLALAAHPDRPRRWAVGAYFEGVAEMTSLGEMHVRGTHYIGVAPLPHGLVNACVVTADRTMLGDPDRLLMTSLNAEPDLRERFRSARMVSRPVMLGPLAVECPLPGMCGLLLAGDAAGFIDPMTGDGLRFALRGAELAALEGLRALETGAGDAHLRLAAARRREFRPKWRFNRALRRLAGSRRAVCAASYATRWTSWPLSRIVRYAGDLSAA